MQRHRSPVGQGHHSIAAEDYLRTIIALEDAGETLSTSCIAGQLGIACASVTQMAQRLAALDLIEYLPYRPLRLTSAGRRVAVELQNRHQMLCAYLECELGYDTEDAMIEADRLEHAMSPELCRRIQQRIARGCIPTPQRGAA